MVDYVKQLVNAGMSETDAQDEVKKITETVKRAMPNEQTTLINAVIGIRVKQVADTFRYEPFNITVVSVGPKRDKNAYKRNVAVNIYNENPEVALMQGLVKVVTSNTPGAIKANDGNYILPIDNRKYWDEAGTKKNYGYGKPFKPQMSRDIIAIYDKSIIKAYGDVDLEVGNEYTVFGTFKNNVINIVNTIKPKLIAHYDHLYQRVLESAANCPFAMGVDDALNSDISGTVIVKGIVIRTTPTHITIAGDAGGEMSVFISDPSVELGSEILAVGYLKNSSNPQFGKSLSATSIIPNPIMSHSISKVLEELMNNS